MDRMTPIKAQVLLHCYYACGDYPEDTPAVREAYRWAEGHLLIEKHAASTPVAYYITTRKGNALVAAMLEIPMPVLQCIEAWVIPEADDV